MTLSKSVGVYLIVSLMAINHVGATANINDGIHLEVLEPSHSTPLLNAHDTQDSSITINDPQLKPAKRFLEFDLNFQIIAARFLKAGAGLSGASAATLIGLKAFDKLPDSMDNSVFYATVITSSASLFFTSLYQYVTRARTDIEKELVVTNKVNKIT